MENKPILLCIVKNHAELIIKKSLLESNDIPHFIVNENICGHLGLGITGSGFGDESGRVQILVLDSDYDRAIQTISTSCEA
jgi:hypothetical protein